MSEKKGGAPSRRAVLGGGLAALGGGFGQRAAAQQKLAKNAVQYQDQPKNGQKCSDCVNFVPPRACKIVEGDISPNGYCIAFAPKSG